MVYKVKLTNEQLFKSFQIDLRDFFNMRARVVYHMHLQPSEFMDSPYYEYQYYVKDLINILKESNEESTDNKYNVDDTYDKMSSDMSSKMRSMGKGFRMPNLPKI